MGAWEANMQSSISRFASMEAGSQGQMLTQHLEETPDIIDKINAGIDKNASLGIATDVFLADKLFGIGG